EIKEMSVVEVITPSSFKTAGEQLPVMGGVHDPRMGTIEAETVCKTCNNARLSHDASNSCPGHFGHIALAVPIPKVGYLGYNKNYAKATYPILNVLNNVCHTCFEINLPHAKVQALEKKVDAVFTNNRRNYSGYNDIKTILKIAMEDFHGSPSKDTRRPCDICGQFTPIFKFSHKSGEFFIPLPDERYLNGAKVIDYREAYEVFRNIRDDRCKYLGLDHETSRPEDLFFINLPVAPNTARPSKNIPGVPLKELDDLTKLYQDVVAANEKLRDIIIRKLGYQSRATTQLYHAVSRVYDNQRESIGSGGTSMMRGFAGAEKAVSFKGIINRLSGKSGRFRNDLQSKYVEDVGYSIIVPDPALAIDEVGVPIEMAMEATVFEEVTADNFARIKQLMINGSDVYPGAKVLIVDGDVQNKGENRIQLKGTAVHRMKQFDERVIIGSVIERHIVDGDYGLFNRAPSLHRQSVLALRARVYPEKALAMNPTVCIPFNADYDGDAMKLHFVQSPEAIEEARRLMALDKNLIHA
ncbi:MAG TPA: hypothetical protein EYQ00_15900, partial [Dehalococcoidia bacterium]|nr:hypothetical protein [Dehalococcoidia bacterium]